MAAVLAERRHRQDEARRDVEVLRPEAQPDLPPPATIATPTFPLAQHFHVECPLEEEYRVLVLPLVRGDVDRQRLEYRARVREFRQRPDRRVCRFRRRPEGRDGGGGCGGGEEGPTEDRATGGGDGSGGGGEEEDPPVAVVVVAVVVVVAIVVVVVVSEARLGGEAVVARERRRRRRVRVRSAEMAMAARRRGGLE